MITRTSHRISGRRAIIDPQSDGPPVEVVNAEGKGVFVLVCEHASNRIPVSLNGLGLASPLLASHVAWDPGAAGVARAMSDALDAPLVRPRFSRLVYDCNRPPEAESAMPVRSETVDVPGNRNLTEAQRTARIAEVYVPFRDTLAALLSKRGGRDAEPVLVTVHSFTPVYAGQQRTLDLGILHDSDGRLADALLRCVERRLDLVVRRNAPYGPEDGVTHTLASHAIPRGLLNVMLEIRNDLIADPAGQERMAILLSACLREALADLHAATDTGGMADSAA
jgi:predicted N-formylglutamate amidohydrolase